MGIWVGLLFWILALLATWTTATFLILKSQTTVDEDMENLYEQVSGAVRNGDTARALLLLEGEHGNLASLLSGILSESTKFNPRLRVTYKITLESLKRRSLITLAPLRVVYSTAPVIGVMALLSPIISLFRQVPAAWGHALFILVLSLLIMAAARYAYSIAGKKDEGYLEAVGNYGRLLLNSVLSIQDPTFKTQEQV